MMGKKWTYIAIFGIACMMTGVQGSENNSTSPPPSTNITTNLNHMQPDNTTTDANQTQPNNMTTNPYQAQPNLTTNTNQVTRDNCRKDRACFSTPVNCDPSNSNGCYFVSTRTVDNNSDNITFELSGDSSGYIAVGLSKDDKEGDGDTVYSCANNNGVVKLIRASLNNSILAQDNTFNPGSFRGSVTNSRIQCIFEAAGLSNTTRPANTPAYLFYFTGNYTNGTLGSPLTRMKTNGPVDLSNPNSSDVTIITPTASTSNTDTTTTATTFTNKTTAARPATTASSALQHATSQAAVVILAGILAIML